MAAKGAKVGMMLFEVRRAAAAVAEALRADAVEPVQPVVEPVHEVAVAEVPVQHVEPLLAAVPPLPAEPVAYATPSVVADAAWPPYAQNGVTPAPADNPHWS